LVILIGQAGRPTSDGAALAAIAGLSLGLDLTLRALQDSLKQQGLPWERAKAFDGSAPIGTFHAYQSEIELDNIHFLCTINDVPRQQGNSRDMIFTFPKIIQALARVWTLMPGDLIYTGTPSGVGVLETNDRISVASPGLGDFHWHVI
jgi:2-keto-4-pentenoate hydratase/2-oxohepta-3-ene-1,7-dioic acid hydratase in catechol pathway